MHTLNETCIQLLCVHFSSAATTVISVNFNYEPLVLRHCIILAFDAIRFYIIACVQSLWFKLHPCGPYFLDHQVRAALFASG